ncbi:hypothetical protein CRG98_014404 [Punica granatum]|uniref:DUF4283 domain-containing protein n=1 Tax=Punica granatum TaxID=22663 RepID=A0A2I0K9M8_PUNGR|nr:hypothetical protein CRG98_014404 [Punica granatum]
MEIEQGEKPEETTASPMTGASPRIVQYSEALLGNSTAPPVESGYVFSSKWEEDLAMIDFSNDIRPKILTTEEEIYGWSSIGRDACISYSITDLPNDHYLARFSSAKDREWALTGGPWVIQDHYLTIREWTPDFNPWTSKVERIAVWVWIPSLPLQYHCGTTLRRIGIALGRPLRVDKHIQTARRGAVPSEEGVKQVEGLRLSGGRRTVKEESALTSDNGGKKDVMGAQKGRSRAAFAILGEIEGEKISEEVMPVGGRIQAIEGGQAGGPAVVFHAQAHKELGESSRACSKPQPKSSATPIRAMDSCSAKKPTVDQTLKGPSISKAKKAPMPKSITILKRSVPARTRTSVTPIEFPTLLAGERKKVP